MHIANNDEHACALRLTHPIKTEMFTRLEVACVPSVPSRGLQGRLDLFIERASPLH